MSVTSVNVLAPIVPGRELALDEHLRALPTDLFDAVPGTHFARFVIIGETTLVRMRNRLRMKYLLFAAAFDAPVSEYADAVRLGLNEAADAIWANCVGYPSWRLGARFRTWFAHNSLAVPARFVEWPDLTVAEVDSLLTLRELHGRFAVAAQQVDDATLLARFRTEFPA